MRIYKLKIEHKTYGLNWSSTKVVARTFEEAVRKTKRELSSRERIESVELQATTE
jgi:hypothetical protein